MSALEATELAPERHGRTLPSQEKGYGSIRLSGQMALSSAPEKADVRSSAIDAAGERKGAAERGPALTGRAATVIG